MIDFSTLKTILIVLGPFLIPKAIGFYRSIRVPSGSPKPLSIPAKVLLNILLVTALLALASTMSIFQPENIVQVTKSRLLQTSNDVLTRRLHNLRLQEGFDNITTTDAILLDKVKTRDGRLLYAAFGQKPLVECVWCQEEDPVSYLYYTIPSIALPHLLHTAILGMVTSGIILKEGRVWRTHATVAGLGLALMEVFMLWRNDLAANTRVFRLEDTIWFYWRMLTVRGIAIALVDGMLGLMIYLTVTKRIGNIVTDGERIETTARLLEVTVGAARAGNFMKGAIMEDPKLRDQMTSFWASEEEELKLVLRDQEITEAQKTTMAAIDLERMGNDAEAYIDAVTKMIKFRKTFIPTKPAM